MVRQPVKTKIVKKKKFSLSDRQELWYIDICRKVCLRMGVRVHGSSCMSGCSYHIPPPYHGHPNHDTHFPHFIVERIAAELGIDASRYAFEQIK